ncbi:MAG: chromosome segregation SMC family protein [Nitrososphaerales archaeon]
MAFIKRLEIKGFKSFGEKTVSLKFEPGFTAITGPNGGGKSNIMDAILFALGENNPKALRVNKLSSLIYESGESRLPSTRVSIVFDNTDKSIPVDSETVTVTREMDEKGESTYYLNGKKTTRNVVVEIMSLALITREGFNVVPQGMVMHISEMHPDDKRRLIEDIAGVSPFDAKKAEALKQLQEADMRLQVAMARIGEIEQRVYALEGERNDQLRLRHLEDEVRWAKALIASRNIALARRRRQEEEVRAKENSARLQELNNRLNDLKTEIANVEEEKKNFLSNVVDSSAGRLVDLQSKIGKLLYEEEKLRSEKSNASLRLFELREETPKLKERLQTLLVERKNFEEQLKEDNQKLKVLEDEKARLEKDIFNLQKEKARLQKIILNLNNRVERLKIGQSKLTARLTELRSKVELDKQRKNMLEESLNNIKERSATFLETLNTLEQHLNQIRQFKESEQNSLNKLKEDADSLTKRIEAVNKELTLSLGVLDKASRKLLQIDAQQSTIESVAPEEVSVDLLIQAAKDGAVEGVIGRFGDLISFKDEYKAAVLAAADEWADALVVADVKAMLRVAETAKRLKVKKLKIIPLSEVAEVELVRKPLQAGLLGSLADYVDCGSNFRGLVNFIIGDTVLAETPRAAYLASRQGLRAVTLQGYLFEPESKGFRMGFSEKLRNLSNILTESSAKEDVAKALKALEDMIRKRKSELASLNKELTRLKDEQIKKTVSVEKIEAEAATISKAVERYSRLGNKVKRRIAAEAQKIEAIERRIDRTLTKITNIESMLKTIEERIKDLSAKIPIEEEQRIAEEIASKQKTLEELANQIREQITTIAKRKSELDYRLMPNIQEVEKVITEYDTEVKELEAFLNSSEEKRNTIAKELETLKEEESILLSKSKQSRSLIEEYESKLKHLRSQEEALRRSISVVEKELLLNNKNLEMLADAEHRYLSELSIYGYTEPIEYFDGVDELIKKLSEEYDELRRQVNLLADAQYKETYIGYKNLSTRRNQLEAEKEKIIEFIEKIEAEKKKVFMETFEKIDKELRVVFSKITGGSAWLEIENPDDIFGSGVFLMTQFPNKLPRESSSVSGGEKTVAAVSFILAIQAVYPSPFYLFDEVDAHLDAVNVERVAALLKERSEKAQIIAISLRDAFIANATTVYGVYMVKGVSNIVRYKPSIEVAARKVE